MSLGAFFDAFGDGGELLQGFFLRSFFFLLLRLVLGFFLYLLFGLLFGFLGLSFIGLIFSLLRGKGVTLLLRCYP